MVEKAGGKVEPLRPRKKDPKYHGEMKGRRRKGVKMVSGEIGADGQTPPTWKRNRLVSRRKGW